MSVRVCLERDKKYRNRRQSTEPSTRLPAWPGHPDGHHVAYNFVQKAWLGRPTGSERMGRCRFISCPQWFSDFGTAERFSMTGRIRPQKSGITRSSLKTGHRIVMCGVSILGIPTSMRPRRLVRPIQRIARTRNIPDRRSIFQIADQG